MTTTTTPEKREADRFEHFLTHVLKDDASRNRWVERIAKIQRCDFADCNHPLQSGGNCKLDPNHRGRHAQFGVFACDNCGKKRRGYPSNHVEYGDICFMCERGLA